MTGKLLVAATVALLWPTSGSGEGLPIQLSRIDIPGWSIFRMEPVGDRVIVQTDLFGPPAVFVTDGTEASTRRLAVPGSLASWLLGVRGPQAFVSAWSPLRGEGVFAFDLQAKQAPRLIKQGSASRAVASDWGFFFVLGSGKGPGLYFSDGTPAGTRLISPGPIGALVSVGRDMLFWTPPGPGEVDASLHRARGPVVTLVGRFAAGESSRPDGTFVRFGSQGAFLQDSTVWVTDGTPEGTRSLQTQTDWFEIGGCGNELLFFKASPAELWATDGTLAGTRILAALPEYAWPFALADADGLCYFQIAGYGAELWKTDLTPLGTTRVASTDPVVFPENANAIGVRGRAFFDGSATLWTSDGTMGGTHPIAEDVHPHLEAPFARAGNRIFFGGARPDALDSMQASLWSIELPPALVIEDAQVRERVNGIATARFPVRLRPRVDEEVVVHFETEPATASAGTDFLSAAGTLRFSPGERLKYVHVPVPWDGMAEGPESFTVRLTAPSGAEIERPVATGTILDSGGSVPGPRR